MPNFPNALTRLVTDLDEGEVTFEWLEKNIDMLHRLAELGLFLPKDRAFSYEGLGVLVQSSNPKESDQLVEQLKVDLGERVQILAKGIPTIYQEKKFALPQICVSDLSGGYPDLLPVLEPEDAKSVDLRAIIILKGYPGLITTRIEGVPFDDILEYFLWQKPNTLGQEHDQLVYRIKASLSGVRVFATSMDGVFYGPRGLGKVAREVKERLYRLKG